jgi:hypothetical protein
MIDNATNPPAPANVNVDEVATRIMSRGAAPIGSAKIFEPIG